MILRAKKNKYAAARCFATFAMFLLMLVLMASTGLLYVQKAYSDAIPNEEGYEFMASPSDGSGEITYMVTTPASSGAAGEVRLVDGGAYKAISESSKLVIDTVANNGYIYNITSIERRAFRGNENLYHLVIAHDLTGVSTGTFGQLAFQLRAIGDNAFSECANLTSVEFTSSKLNGIGSQAFLNCGKLSSVTFADGYEIYGTDHAFSIGAAAFAGTALTEIKIPKLTSATRTGDYYNDYAHDYARLPEDRDVSGYMGCWHDKLNYFGIESRAICENAFANTKLEKIVFAAGNDTGLFACWSAAGAGLQYLPTLKSVVYEASQPYYGNPNAGMNNGTVKNVWGLASDDDADTPVAEPTFYYAVDFYATAAQADADNAAGDGRIARVEYARNTPVSAIQGADHSALASYEYASPADYAQDGYADGTTPDPDEAARAAQAKGTAGFENASSYEWVWMLGDTQSRRAGLSDSCKAYLAKANDISAGRVGTSTDGADQLGTMYQLCDQNLSQGSTQNSAFDYKRYYAGDSVYMFNEDTIKRGISMGTNNLAEGKTPWFTISSKGAKGLLAQLHFYDAKGNELDVADESKFQVTFSLYNNEAGALEQVEFNDITEGPVLITLTPLENSGYSMQSDLQEWVLLEGSTSTVKTLYTDAAHDTWRSAVYSNGLGRANPNSFNISSGFTVAVSSGDMTAALSAAGYAGMVKGAVNVISSDADYGFGIAWPGTYYSTGEIYGDVSMFNHEKKESLSSYAVNNYKAFNQNRDRWGLDSSYAWGDTAVLANPEYTEEVAVAAASYAYAKAAPIFYTESDGSLAKDVIECLGDFKNVLVLGDESMVAASSTSSLSANVTRVTGTAAAQGGKDELGNACSLSLAVAQLLSEGDNATNNLTNVAIVVASGPDAVTDAVSVMNFSGHNAGVSLSVASTADAKRVAQYLRSNRDDVGAVRVFGRSSDAANGNGFKLVDALQNTWNEKAESIPAVAKGDTLELYGVSFEIGSNNALSASGVSSRMWGSNKVKAGSYAYWVDANGNAAFYTLGKDYSSAVSLVKAPSAKTGLVYNGTQQVGIAAGKGYEVKNGSAKNADTYVATITLKQGYRWSDGTKDKVKLSWTIDKASLKGARIFLSSTRVTLANGAAKPAVTKVLLANGHKISSDDYRVSYSNNMSAGKAKVSISGRNNCTNVAGLTFTVVNAASGGQAGGSDTGGSGSSSNGGGSGGSGTSGDTNNNNGSDGGSTTNGATDGGADGDDNRVTVDGWTYFAPQSTPEASDTSLLPSVESPEALNVAILLICCLSFAGAIFYSTRARKETDDQLKAGADA